MKHCIFTLALGLFSWMCHAQVEAIAYYPFSLDVVDSITGQSAFVQNATFSEGGIYANGIYYGNDTRGTEIITAPLERLNFSNFQFSLDFRIDSLPDLSWMPIIVGGPSWRWLTILVEDDGILGIRASTTSGTTQMSSSESVPLGEWHQLDVEYMNQVLSVSLNGTEALNFQVEQFVDGEDQRLICAHNGIGRTFQGYWRNLRVYSGEGTTRLPHSSTSTLTLYPNPSASFIRVSGLNRPQVETLQLIDRQGRLWREVPAQPMPIELNIRDIPPGVYFLLSKNRSLIQPKKVVIHR